MKGFIAAFLGGLVIAYLMVLGAAGGSGVWLLIIMIALLFAVFCTIFSSLFNKLEQLETAIKKLSGEEAEDVSRETSVEKTGETGSEE